MTQRITTPASIPVSLRERVDPARHRNFARAAFLKAQAREKKVDFDRFIEAEDPVTRAILGRANAPLGTTGNAGFGAEVKRESWRAFLTSLAPYSGAARLIAQALPAQLNTDVEAHYPIRAAGPATPAWVAEGDPIPVRSVHFDDVVIGPARKMAHLLLWTRELSKRSDADAIFETMLREDVAAGLDAAFFATTAGSSAGCAGLLYGVTPLTASGASGKLGLTEDLAALGAAASAGGSGRVTYVMAPERLSMTRVIAPELVASLDIAPSAAVPSTRVIAVDAAALLVGVDADPEITASEYAVVHMSDVPLEVVSDAPVTADPVRSTWQTASTALRVIHEMAFAKRRATAVAYLDGAFWS